MKILAVLVKWGWLLAAAAAVLAGCAAKNSNYVQPSISPEQLIARDLVSVLVQLDELPVDTSVLKLASGNFAEGDFAQSLRAALQDAGYNILLSGRDPGEIAVSFSAIEKIHPKDGPVITYTVSAGEVSVRRAYKPSDGGFVQPLAAMQVRGADASAIRPGSDDMFGNSASAVKQISKLDPVELLVVTPSTEITEDVKIAENENDGVDEPSAPTLSGKQKLEPLLPELPDSKPLPLSELVKPTSSIAGTSSFAENLGIAKQLPDSEKRNVYDLRQSNFAAVFDNMSIVDEIILRFGSDSERLGAKNKALVQRVVGKFDAGSDVVSVIGCSNGPTTLTIGQKGLAMGRAERVKAELLYSGIPEENILDEGCWAEEAFDNRMPRSGVVLTLKRSTS